MDKGPPGAHPGKPIDLNSLQDLSRGPFALLGEYEGTMPPFFQSFDEGQEKRSLDKIIGMRGEGRSDDTKIQVKFPSYFSSLLYSMSNHIAKKRDWRPDMAKKAAKRALVAATGPTKILKRRR